MSGLAWFALGFMVAGVVAVAAVLAHVRRRTAALRRPPLNFNTPQRVGPRLPRRMAPGVNPTARRWSAGEPKTQE